MIGKNKLKAFISNDAANIVLISAILIPVLVAVVGIGVDFSRYLSARNEFVSVIDQAALSASTMENGNERAEVLRQLQLNLPQGLQQMVEVSDIRVVPLISDGRRSVAVEVDANIRTLFARAIGVDRLDISHQVQATRNEENVELVITMSNAGTMCSHKDYREDRATGRTILALRPDETCAHFNAMKDGVERLINILSSNAAFRDVRIGFVPFSYKVRMPHTSLIPPAFLRNEHISFFQTFDDVGDLGPVMPLTNNFTRAKQVLLNMRLSPRNTAWSRTNLGTQTAAMMLDPEYFNFYNGGIRPQSFNDPNTRKILIMMTDGVNAGCCFTNWPADNFDNQYVYMYRPDNENQRELCSALKAEGVEIFSIIFDVDEDFEGGAEIHDIFARCASEYGRETIENPAEAGVRLACSDRQNCYNITETDELRRVYSDIAQSFLISKITR